MKKDNMTVKLFSVIGLCCFFVLCTFDNAWADWPFVTQRGIGTSSPIVGDLDGDGNMEILIMSTDDNLYCLNKKGEVTWKVAMNISSLGSTPAIADINGDGNLEILVGSFDGDIYCISWIGQIIWRYNTYVSIISSPAVSDIDGDGNYEILIGSEDAHLYCINKNGTLRWKFHVLHSSFDSSPAVEDLNGDGNHEILVGCQDNSLYCINKNGQLVWKYDTSYQVYSSPAIADITGDGYSDIVVGSADTYIHCVGNTGKVIWRFATYNWNDSSPAIADLDSDGRLEVITGSFDHGNLYCIDRDGVLVWKYKTNGPVDSSPAICDLNEDGDLETLFGSWDGNFYCLNRLGQLVWKYRTGGIIRSSPAIADLDGDGNLEVLFGSGDGKLYCLNKDGQTFVPSEPQGPIDPMPWPMFHHDLQHTGNYHYMPNQPPVLAPIGNQKETNEGELLEFTISATDPDVNNTLTYSASNLPKGANFDPETQTFTWIPDYDQAGTYTDIKFTVSDGALTDEEVITITVNNTNRAPVLNPINNKAVNEGEVLQFTISATDPDGDTIIYSAENLPTGAGFDTQTGQFSWTPTYDQAGSYVVTFTASDSNLYHSESISITVNNVEKITLSLQEQSPIQGDAHFDLVMEGINPNDIKWGYAYLYIDGIYKDGAFQLPYAVVYKTNLLENGPHQAKAYVYIYLKDNTRKNLESNIVEFSTDNTIVYIPKITAPTPNSVISQPTIVEAQFNAPEKPSLVYFYLGQGNNTYSGYIGYAATSPYQVTLDPNKFKEGDWQIICYAYYRIGTKYYNVQSEPLPITIRHQTQLPPNIIVNGNTQVKLPHYFYLTVNAEPADTLEITGLPESAHKYIYPGWGVQDSIYGYIYYQPTQQEEFDITITAKRGDLTITKTLHIQIIEDRQYLYNYYMNLAQTYRNYAQKYRDYAEEYPQWRDQYLRLAEYYEKYADDYEALANSYQ